MAAAAVGPARAAGGVRRPPAGRPRVGRSVALRDRDHRSTELVDEIETLPAVSSVALARARMRWPAESSVVLTLVGRDHRRTPARARARPPPARPVLRRDDRRRGRAAAPRRGPGVEPDDRPRGSRLGRRETDRRHRRRPVDRRCRRLHVLALDLVGPPSPTMSWAAGLPDDVFEHDGQLTKRDLRASALAGWPRARRAALGRRRRRRLGRYRVAPRAPRDGGRRRRGRPRTRRPDRPQRRPPRRPTAPGRHRPCPDALGDLPAPDAVFVGGGASDQVVAELPRRARTRGRLVAHGVTLETEQLLAASYHRHGGELTRISVEHAAPLGDRTGWAPLRTVTQWAVVR